MTRLRYMVDETIDNVRFNQGTTVTALITTTFTMLGMGLFLLIYFNIQGFLGSLREEIKIIVYLKDTATSGEITRLQAQLARDTGMTSMQFVSRDDALKSFRARFPSEERLLAGLGNNPFPASFVIKPGPRYRSAETVAVLVQRLQNLPEVEEVLYNRGWIENLGTALRYVEMLGMGLGLILAAAMVTILANTIRLTLYTRREDIEILRLIGATATFIKTPFVLEGALLGGLGASAALILLRTLFSLVETKLVRQSNWEALTPSLAFLPGRIALAMIVLGILLGCLGSVLSLVRLDATRN